MNEFFSNIMTREKYVSIVIIIIGIIMYLLIKKIIKRIIKKSEHKSRLNRKKRTYLKLFNSILKYVLIIIIALLVLQINGVNVTSIMASLGLVSVIVGFALQDALKDIIMGINIVIDDFFSVGDVLKIGEVEGKVTEIGLKSTKMKDINNGNVFVISNRNICEALTLSDQLDIDIPIPYEQKVEKVEKVIDEIVKQVSAISDVNTIEYRGLNEFGDSALFYKIRISCKPEHKPQVKRDANRIIKLELDKNKINIPYQQIDIHSK